MRFTVVAVLLIAGCGPKASGAEDGTTGGATTGGASTGAATTSGTSTGAVEPTSEGGAVTTGPAPSQCPGQNNHVEDDKCFCDPGYLWCDLEDEEDLSCCPDEEVTTLETLTTPTTDGPGEAGDSTSGEPVACDAPPPDACDPAVEAVYCQQGAGCTVEGSAIFWCEGGSWQPNATTTNEECAAKGDDFAFGCRTENGVVLVECGEGPGTACTPEWMGLCIDEKTLEGCKQGKVAHVDCEQACKSGEVDGTRHDSGFCVLSRISAECGCCDGADCP